MTEHTDGDFLRFADLILAEQPLPYELLKDLDATMRTHPSRIGAQLLELAWKRYHHEQRVRSTIGTTTRPATC